MHALPHQLADIGVAGQEPQHLARRHLPIDALGRQQRHGIVCQRESHRRAQDRSRADAGSVDPLVAIPPDPPHQVQILLLIMWRGRGGCVGQGDVLQM